MKRIVVCSAVLGEVEAMQKKKKNIYIYIYIFFTKQRKFHQVKVTSPFLLNKIMATTNYRTVEEDSFYINYKTAEEACCKAS